MVNELLRRFVAPYAADERLLFDQLPRADDNAVRAIPDAATNYIVCYVQRSGSTHLTSMLQNTAAAGKPADFFNLGYSYMDRERVSVEGRTGVSTVASAKAAYGVETIGEYLNVLSRQTRSQNGAFGLKVDLNHASILMRDGYFFDPAWNWKYIYVTRHDLVQQAVSYAIAQNTGHWSQTGAVQEAPLPSRDAVIDALLFLSDLMRRWECIFSLLGILPLRVSYEEIAGDPRGCLERCLQHIGVSAPENLQLSSNYVKQRSAESERLADEIRNGFRL